MARIYSNENFPRSAVEELRRLGHDVLTVSESGHANIGWPDEDVLSFAARDARTVVTLNRKDFVRLHRDVPEHAGIIVCTQDADRVALAQRIHRAIEEAGEIRGRLLRIVRPAD